MSQLAPPKNALKPGEPPIRLLCSDGEVLAVDMASCMESERLKSCVKDGIYGPMDITLPIHIVAKAVYFIKKYSEIKACRNTDEMLADQKLKDFISEFVNENRSLLVDVLDAAHQLHIKSLINLMREAIVYMIAGKTREEIRKIFNLEKDLTLQEILEAHKYEAWAFE